MYFFLFRFLIPDVIADTHLLIYAENIYENIYIYYQGFLKFFIFIDQLLIKSIK